MFAMQSIAWVILRICIERYCMIFMFLYTCISLMMFLIKPLNIWDPFSQKYNNQDSYVLNGHSHLLWKNTQPPLSSKFTYTIARTIYLYNSVFCMTLPSHVYLNGKAGLKLMGFYNKLLYSKKMCAYLWFFFHLIVCPEQIGFQFNETFIKSLINIYCHWVPILCWERNFNNLRLCRCM